MFTASLVVVGVIVVACLIAILTTIYIVPQQMVYIIERFGKFNSITTPGIHVRIPLIDRIAGKISLKTSQTKFTIGAKTKDNVTINLNVAAQYCVDTGNGDVRTSNSGVYRAFYMLSNPIDQMNAYLADALRSSIPKYDLDEVFDRKDNIANDVNQTVAELMNQYGYKVVSTLIVNIELPRDVEESMNKINSAQREKAAAKDLAEAEKIKVVVEAEAAAEKMRLQGEGIAQQRKAIAEGIKESLEVIQKAGVDEQEANTLFMYTQYIDMMADFAKNSSNSTIVLPSNFNEHSSMFEQMLVANKSNSDIIEA